MEFIRVADISEIPAGSKKVIEVDGNEILLVNVEGNLYAISNKCPHAGASLSQGLLEGYFITCPKHEAKFDIRTGKTVSRGKLGFLQFNVNDITCYSVKIDNNSILLEKH